MKKLSLTLVVMACISLTTFAQEKRAFKHHEIAKHHHGMLAKELNLTDAQKAQLKSNHESFRQKMQELNKNESMTLKDFRNQKFALRKQQRASMVAMLTPDQKAKMAQLKATHMAKKQEHFAGHLAKIKTQLALTDDQVARLKEQHDAMHTRMMAIKENQSLSREQLRDQLTALKKETKEQHKKIFTDDQLKKMEEMKKHPFEKTPAK